MTPLAILLTLIGAVALDGDTLKHDGQRYRIFGIDAPERAEMGGTQSTIALQGLIAGKALDCTVLDVDRYGRPVVICALPDGRDVACEMVAQGHARDWPRFSGGMYAECAE